MTVDWPSTHAVVAQVAKQTEGVAERQDPTNQLDLLAQRFEAPRSTADH